MYTLHSRNASAHCQAVQQDFRALLDEQAGTELRALPLPDKPDKPDKPERKPKPAPKPKDNLTQLRAKSKNITDWIHDTVTLQTVLQESRAAPAFVQAQVSELQAWQQKFNDMQQRATAVAGRTGQEGVLDEAS